MPGLIIILIAIFFGFITGIFAKVPNKGKESGVVVSTEYIYDTDETKPTYTAIVEYQVNGKIYVTKSKYKSSSFYIGQRLTVIYDTTNPQASIIKPSIAIYIIFILLIVTGIIIAFISFQGRG